MAKTQSPTTLIIPLHSQFLTDQTIIFEGEQTSKMVLKFKVQRKKAEIITPSKPTPHEFKHLSEIDKGGSFRGLIMPHVQIYTNNPLMEGKDPVKTLKESLSQTLVFFYPLAGRLREFSGSNSLVVECNGEGVIFVEAEADISFEDLLDQPLHPPFSYLDEVLGPNMDTKGFDCPLVHVQVTRLKCGGIIMGLHFRHDIMDGTGCAYFLKTWGEISKGSAIPSIPPTWQRHLLCARNPPLIKFTHHELDNATKPQLLNNKSYRVFYFTPTEISILRQLVPHDHRHHRTTFELLTACIWIFRTRSLQLNPNDEVKMIFLVNARNIYNPPFPKGYYGNAIGFGCALTTAGELCEDDNERSFGFALELIMKAKNNVSEEYMRSFVDLLASKACPRVPVLLSSFMMTDMRRLGFGDVDFGWGKAVYGGPGVAWFEPPELESYYLPGKSSEGEDVIMVPICLPAPAMDIFVKEMHNMLKIHSICYHQ